MPPFDVCILSLLVHRLAFSCPSKLFSFYHFDSSSLPLPFSPVSLSLGCLSFQVLLSCKLLAADQWRGIGGADQRDARPSAACKHSLHSHHPSLSLSLSLSLSISLSLCLSLSFLLSPISLYLSLNLSLSHYLSLTISLLSSVDPSTSYCCSTLAGLHQCHWLSNWGPSDYFSRGIYCKSSQ